MDDSKISLLSSDKAEQHGYGSTIQDTNIDEELAKNGNIKRKESGGFEIAPGQVTVNTNGKYGGFSLRKLWAFTGPGFLMSIAYLDPGNIEADLQGGAIAKYKLLWVLLWTTILGLIMQLLSARLGCVVGMNLAELCRHEYPKGPRLTIWLLWVLLWTTILGLIMQLLSARLGCVVGMNLAELCRHEYPKVPRLTIWVAMELAIISNDIQEVIGSALAINLLSSNKIPIWAGVLITGADTFTFLFLESYGLRKLEALFGALITTMAASFIYMYITVVPDQVEVVKGLFIPYCTNCTKDDVQQMVGILGAIIQPSNLYLHSALVLSRVIDRKDKRAISEANLYNGIESAIALFVSLLINLSVMSVFAAAFSDPHYHDASLSNAGGWLYDKYGLAMKIIWGIGILASGQSSTMTGTYAGQFVMQGFINITWAKWKRVLLTRSIAMIPTIVVALVATRDLDAMNNWVNVFQSVVLPFSMLPLLTCTSDPRVMGDFKNGIILKMISWALALVVMVANFYLVALFVGTGEKWWVYAVTALILLIYILFVSYMAIGPTRMLRIKLYLYKKLNKDTTYLREEVRRRDDLDYTEYKKDDLDQDGNVNS